MSYDIWLESDAGGREPMTWGHWNYTSNCAPMWREAGADLAGYAGKVARDCLPSLRDAITLMEAEPARFEAMNPKNGWGSYESFLPALRNLREMFETHPNAKVGVSR